MSHELSIARKWIYRKLSGDGTLNGIIGTRIYFGQAPEKALYPFITFSHQGGLDVQGLGTVRILARPLYLIKLITDGAPDANAKTVMDRIDEVIGKAVAEAIDGLIISARRTQPIQFIEPKPDSAGFWTHEGGIYRLEIHPA